MTTETKLKCCAVCSEQQTRRYRTYAAAAQLLNLGGVQANARAQAQTKRNRTESVRARSPASGPCTATERAV